MYFINFIFVFIPGGKRDSLDMLNTIIKTNTPGINY